jgi:sulfur carrier protein ThiS
MFQQWLREYAEPFGHKARREYHNIELAVHSWWFESRKTCKTTIQTVVKTAQRNSRLKIVVFVDGRIWHRQFFAETLLSENDSVLVVCFSPNQDPAYDEGVMLDCGWYHRVDPLLHQPDGAKPNPMFDVCVKRLDAVLPRHVEFFFCTSNIPSLALGLTEDRPVKTCRAQSFALWMLHICYHHSLRCTDLGKLLVRLFKEVHENDGDMARCLTILKGLYLETKDGKLKLVLSHLF